MKKEQRKKRGQPVKLGVKNSVQLGNRRLSWTVEKWRNDAEWNGLKKDQLSFQPMQEKRREIREN